MKSLKNLAILLVLAIAITSCNKDDDNSSSTSLIGTWKKVSVTYNGEPEYLDRCERKETWTFEQTQIKFINYGGEDCDLPFESIATYVRDEDFIIFSDGFSLEITKLTSSTLELMERSYGDVFVETFSKQ